MIYGYEGTADAVTANHLKRGEICKVTNYDRFMIPILKPGQSVICVIVTENTILHKNNIVLCKIDGKYYLRKITAIKNGVTYQISDNHGHIEGFISKKNIFGVVVEIL